MPAFVPDTSRVGLLLAFGALTLGALGAGCGGDEVDDPSGASSSSGESRVEALDFEFDPAEPTVEAGAAVTWTNGGETIHNVKGRGFFSRGIAPGSSYEHPFVDPGTYRYLCTLHPTTMRGTISVREEAT